MKLQSYQEIWDIWLESKEKLNRYILSRFKDKELAQDISQDVLLKMHKSCCSDRNIKNINSWLFQIAHNSALDHIKKSKKEFELDIDLEEPQNIWTDLSEFIEPMIDCLPESYAIPLRMFDIEGKSHKVIAEELNLNLSASKSRVHRGRDQLKEQIKSCFHIESNKDGVPISFQLKENCSIKKK